MLETCIIILNWFDCLYLLLSFNRSFEIALLSYVSQILSIEVLTWWSIFIWFKSSKKRKNSLTVMTAAQKQNQARSFPKSLILRPSRTVLQVDKFIGRRCK